MNSEQPSDAAQPVLRPWAAVPGAANKVLDYRKAEAIGAVRIGSVSTIATAQLLANILEADGIPCALQNVNSSAVQGMLGFVQVHLDVPAACAARAVTLLQGLFQDPDAVEPAEDEFSAEARDDSSLAPRVIVGSFDNPRSMRDAAALLGSANIAVHLPRLVARGDRPAGTGRRFVLSVDEPDAERAQLLIARAGREADDERATDDEPRCPNCNEWRVYRHSRQLGNLLRRLAAKATLPDEWECLHCRHRWNVDVK